MQAIKIEKSVEAEDMDVSSLCSAIESKACMTRNKNSNTGAERDIWIKSESETESGVKTSRRGLFLKPQLSYIALISSAIQSSRDKRMLLSEIYEWIVNNFPSFKMANRSWRNSVRHNLSLNECFIKSGRCDSGKGHFWRIHAANLEDFAKGDYRRRHARRLVKKCDELTQLFETDSTTTEASGNSGVPMTSQYGYARMTCSTVSISYIIETFGEAVLSTNGQRHRQKHLSEKIMKGI